MDYYKRRAKLIIKEIKDEEEDENRRKKIKTSNIWLVKTGENSNQGRGITVID